MNEQEARVASGRAVEEAGWELDDDAEPILRRSGDRWEAIFLEDPASPRPQVNVWIEEDGVILVVPVRWPPALPITADEFLRQADRVASGIGWSVENYVRGELFDHGDCWSVLYKGRSGLPGDHFSVELAHTSAALRVVGGC